MWVYINGRKDSVNMESIKTITLGARLLSVELRIQALPGDAYGGGSTSPLRLRMDSEALPDITGRIQP
jgi:hypothetical protein